MFSSQAPYGKVGGASPPKMKNNMSSIETKTAREPVATFSRRPLDSSFEDSLEKRTQSTGHFAQSNVRTDSKDSVGASDDDKNVLTVPIRPAEEDPVVARPRMSVPVGRSTGRFT